MTIALSSEIWFKNAGLCLLWLSQSNFLNVHFYSFFFLREKDLCLKVHWYLSLLPPFVFGLAHRCFITAVVKPWIPQSIVLNRAVNSSPPGIKKALKWTTNHDPFLYLSRQCLFHSSLLCLTGYIFFPKCQLLLLLHLLAINTERLEETSFSQNKWGEKGLHNLHHISGPTNARNLLFSKMKAGNLVIVTHPMGQEAPGPTSQKPMLGWIVSFWGAQMVSLVKILKPTK